MQFMVSMVTDGTFMQGASPEQMKEIGAEWAGFMG